MASGNRPAQFDRRATQPQSALSLGKERVAYFSQQIDGLDESKRVITSSRKSLEEGKKNRWDDFDADLLDTPSHVPCTEP